MVGIRKGKANSDMPERRVKFPVFLLVMGFGLFAMVRQAPAQAAKPGADKKPGVAKPAAVRERPAAPSDAEAKPSSARSESGQAGSGEDRDPVKQLSRQYARRAAARSKEREEATKTPPPANEIHEPVVALSQGHRELCIVYLGDRLPTATLPDAAGAAHELGQSLGARLTVVILWNADNPYALDQFQEMQHELVPLADQGVQTVAIHVGAPPPDYPELCADNGAGTLCLLDADKSYFAKLARAKLPRTYLLDAQGRILWLDLEYSRTTRYDLRNAVHFYLQKQASQK